MKPFSYLFISAILLSLPVYSEKSQFSDRDLEKQDLDELEEIMLDVKGGFFDEKSDESDRSQVIEDKSKAKVEEEDFNYPETIKEFDVGEEEKQLLEYAKNISNKISSKEWSEIVKTTSHNTYTVAEDDTLWRISKTLFGTGFYYSKIWSLNPYITNPHEIEPGMVLAFSSGSESSAPEIQLGTFDLNETSEVKTDVKAPLEIIKEKGSGEYNSEILSLFAEGGYPKWLDEREKLIEQGFYVEKASDFTYEELKEIGASKLNKQYEIYEPPPTRATRELPDESKVGFDRSDIVRDSFKTGFYINTFLVSNAVVDFGFIESARIERPKLGITEIIYVRFNKGARVSPGDQFSVYKEEGEVYHDSSERGGKRYTITGSIVVHEKADDSNLWECEIISVSDIVKRGDRLTGHVPKIDKILTTYSPRKIEAVILGTFEDRMISFGDVVYLDRGRSDGVELGNVFAVYSSLDRGTKKKITKRNDLYPAGELTVIKLSDNFSTAIITESSSEIPVGTAAVTINREEGMKRMRKANPYQKDKSSLNAIKEMGKGTSEELDVEFDLDDIGNDLKEEADQLELSEEEIEELDRQEQEKSIMHEDEQTTRDLDQLEEEIIETERRLNETIEDEDKKLEQVDLDKMEKKLERPEPEFFESLDDVEEEVGRKYLDQEINAQDNPYGLTEFDLEEVDELLNSSSEDESLEASGPTDEDIFNSLPEIEEEEGTDSN